MQKKRTITKSYKTKAPKVLKKSSTKTWICNEGCKLTTVPCEHLEKLIKNPNKEPQFENINRYVGNNIDKAYYTSGAGYVIPEGIKNRSYEFQFRTKLEKAGLEPVKIDILVLRFVYSMTLRDIEQELGMMSYSTVLRLLSESLVYLKKKGIKK